MKQTKMPKISLGYVLTKYRQKFHLTREQVVGKVSISYRVLVVLEERNGRSIDSTTAKDALKRLCYLYHLKYSEVEQIYHEGITQEIVIPMQIRHIWNNLLITDQTVRTIVLGAGFVAIVGYVMWQTLFFIRAPRIQLPGLNDFQYVETKPFTVDGRVDVGGQLTINGTEVILSTDGSFSIDVPLSLGDNPLEFVVQRGNYDRTIVQKIVYLTEKKE